MTPHVQVDDAIYSDSMMPNGWIVVTFADDRDIVYGGFSSKEEAIAHGSKLARAKVMRMFFPTLH